MKIRVMVQLAILFLAIHGSLSLCAARETQPNILVITVDDMNADSVGVYGCQLAETTPNIDQLARQAMRFKYAHVQVGNCMPSRNVMWSGRYPHNNRIEGFYQVKDVTYPVLTDLMKQAGYYTAIRNKVSHSTPYMPYAWDAVLDDLPDGSKAHVKDAKSYGESVSRGIESAKSVGKPFCLLVNISDPHKPFYSQGRGGKKSNDPHRPSRVFTAEECPIPGFLFKDPAVSEELALYYSSVRRADDCVGQILRALDTSGESPNTLVMFLSDHGMPLPFAKTQLYHHSTHTPLMIRWPGVTQTDFLETRHMVSAVDFLPTLLEAVGIAIPKGLDGRSFAPLLKGESQSGRELIFKEYNENAGASRDPMRGVQSKRYLYLFNPWSNGKRVMATATTGTATYRRMAQLAKNNEVIAARHAMYQYRVVEELYDVQADPDCLVNLIESSDHQEIANGLRTDLENWMVQTKDHMLDTFRQRNDPKARESYVQEYEKQADSRRQNRKKKANTKDAPAKRKDLISLEIPQPILAGKSLAVAVQYQLPKSLGKQKIHVTLKGGNNNRRISRKVLTIQGSGTATVTFVVPADVPDNRVQIAVFVGEEFARNLQYILSNVLPVR